MKIKHENFESATVATLKGDMTHDDVESFRRFVNDRIGEHVNDFVIDAGELTFVDSKGLESLLWLQDHVGERLGQVRLVGASDVVRTILKLTRLDHSFDMRDDIQTALKSLH